MEVRQVPGKRQVHRLLENNSSGASGGTGKNDAGTSGKESGTYILNTKTMKFHRTDCDSVKNIKSENRKKYTGSGRS